MERGGIELTVFDRYERRRWDVGAAIGRFFLGGVSARKLNGFAKELCGREVGV